MRTAARPARSRAALLDAVASLDPVSGVASGAPLTLRRAWPRPDGRLLLEYAGPDGAVVGAQAGLDAAAVEDERRRARRAGVPPPVDAATSLGDPVLLHPGGADGRLPGLHAVLARPDAELLGHRPGRRAAVALGADREVFVKAVPPRRAAELAATMHAAQQLAGDLFAVPDLLEVDETAGTVAGAALPGRSLHDLLAEPDGGAVDAARELGAALRALHAADVPPAAAAHDAAREAQVLLRAVDELESYVPALARRTRPAAATAARDLAALPAVAPAPLHRDLHDKQVLVGPDGRIGLIDFDTLAAGDPALDVGNLVAHLHLRGLQGMGSPSHAADATAAFLDGYEAGEQLLRRAEAYAAATLVRLACVYAFRPAWRALGDALPDASVPTMRRRALIRASSSANENGLVT